MSLAKILKVARELEASWTEANRDLTGDPRYRELKNLIAHFPDERLSRLAVQMDDTISIKQFYSVIVPFERIDTRALRDDEFLVTEQDLALPLAKLPLKVIAENIRSAFNVGALFRTAECLGVSEVLLCGYTPGPEDEKTARTSMGTSEMVSWRRMGRATDAIEALRTEGYSIVALETSSRAVALNQMKFAGKTALVVGNERFGVEFETLKAADTVCKIPLRGMKNSMNVGVALGIAAFEWLRQNES